MQVLLSVHTLSQDVHTTLQYKNLDIQHPEVVELDHFLAKVMIN